MIPTHQSPLLAEHLRVQLGDLEPEAMALLQRSLQWVDLPAGSVLMSQGEPGDAMFFTVSGRLRAWLRDADGQDHLLRDMGRGEVIGEMSLYTGEARTATVAAVRDSVLARLPAAAFQNLLAHSPHLSMALTRQVIKRLQSHEKSAAPLRPVTMALVPITAAVDAAAFAAELGTAMQLHGRVCTVNASSVAAVLGEPDLSSLQADAPGRSERLQRVARHLDELESRHDHVLLVADEHASAWTGLCCQHADEVLLLADADQPVALHASEQHFLLSREPRTALTEVLVLLHPPGCRFPRGTAAWLARRSVEDHLHLRRGLDRDMARLARIQSRRAVGLVLAGGGARGLAHLGAAQALRESGIEFDFVGGASIGAVMATLIGMDQDWRETVHVARQSFLRRPTSDYVPVPLLSLIGGRRLRAVLDSAIGTLLGEEPGIEDFWHNIFVVASNYSSASEVVLTQGPVKRALMASVAIPGALPPVLIDGELHCDGGSFNNFPVDVMRRRRGVGQVIGVDLSFANARRYTEQAVPGPWALLLDRLRPRRLRRYRFPSLLAYLLNTTILYSSSRQRQARRLTDLYLNPPLPRVGMLQWHRFDDIMAKGLAYTRAELAGLSPEQGVALGATQQAAAPEPQRATAT